MQAKNNNALLKGEALTSKYKHLLFKLIQCSRIHYSIAVPIAGVPTKTKGSIGMIHLIYFVAHLSQIGRMFRNWVAGGQIFRSGGREAQGVLVRAAEIFGYYTQKMSYRIGKYVAKALSDKKKRQRKSELKAALLICIPLISQ